MNHPKCNPRAWWRKQQSHQAELLAARPVSLPRPGWWNGYSAEAEECIAAFDIRNIPALPAAPALPLWRPEPVALVMPIVRHTITTDHKHAPGEDRSGCLECSDSQLIIQHYAAAADVTPLVKPRHAGGWTVHADEILSDMGAEALAEAELAPFLDGRHAGVPAEEDEPEEVPEPAAAHLEPVAELLADFELDFFRHVRETKQARELAAEFVELVSAC